jgi:hypothetical protein
MEHSLGQKPRLGLNDNHGLNLESNLDQKPREDAVIKLEKQQELVLRSNPELNLEYDMWRNLDQNLVIQPE